MKFFTPKFDVENIYQWSSKFSDCFTLVVLLLYRNMWLTSVFMILLWVGKLPVLILKHRLFFLFFCFLLMLGFLISWSVESFSLLVNCCSKALLLCCCLSMTLGTLCNSLLSDFLGLLRIWLLEWNLFATWKLLTGCPGKAKQNDEVLLIWTPMWNHVNGLQSSLIALLLIKCVTKHIWICWFTSPESLSWCVG